MIIVKSYILISSIAICVLLLFFVGLDFNFTEDSIWKFLTAFIGPCVAAGVGAWGGAYVMIQQNRARLLAERLEKQVQASNVLQSNFSQALGNLITFKENILEKTTYHEPIDRIFSLPNELPNYNLIGISESDFIFILPKVGEISESYINWQQINHISSLIEFYNKTILGWKNNIEKTRIVQKSLIVPQQKATSFSVEKSTVIEALQQGFVETYLSIEQLWVFTDQLILLIEDFLNKFPTIVDKSINITLAKDLEIRRISFKQDKTSNSRKEIFLPILLNYREVEKIFGVEMVEKINKLTTGYEEYINLLITKNIICKNNI